MMYPEVAALLVTCSLACVGMGCQKGPQATVGASNQADSSQTVESLLAIRPRMDEADLLKKVQAEKWECFKQAATDLDGHLPEDLHYTCQVSVDIGFGKFTKLDVVTRVKEGGGRWVMPLLAYTSHDLKTPEECDALAIRAGKLLEKSWPTKVVHETEKTAAVGDKGGTDFETMTLGCVPDQGTALQWMLIPASPQKVSMGNSQSSNEEFLRGLQTEMKIEKGTKLLPQEDIQRVMQEKFRFLAGCLREEAQRNPSIKKLDLEWVITSNGSVTSLKVNGSAGSSVAKCLSAKMEAIHFPACEGCTTHAAFTVGMK